MAFVLALAGAAAVRVMDAVDTLPGTLPGPAEFAAEYPATGNRQQAGGPRIRVEAELAADPFADPLARFSLARESPEGSIR